MINFTVSNDEYFNDLMELVRMFEQRTDENFSLNVKYRNDGEEFIISISSDKFESFSKYYRFIVLTDNDIKRKRCEKRYLKLSIYRTISFLTGVNLPYGCLTGIRPTKLFIEIENLPLEYDGRGARDIFLNEYSVREDKVNLIEQTVRVQKPYRNHSGQCLDVFVFIPFCPSRCAYCSFVSLPLDRQKKLVKPYIDCLINELEQTKNTIRMHNFHIRSVYVGGGTPTSIGADMLDKVLEHCHFEEFGSKEFTVEAGRPDTIDKNIVNVLLKHKVTRVSVNPQTFNDKTLEFIGRRHRAADIYNAYALVKGKFDVNMDLIAMLPNESFEDFKKSVDIAVSLNPENITVHTLYLKKGSPLKLKNYDNSDFLTSSNMVEYAYKALSASGYLPYYMYRQKYTSGNLENVGYCKPDKECIYNIDIMEEDTSILANGAAAISKKWTKDINLIERCANYKEPLEYIKHFNKLMDKQRIFWDNK